MFGNTIMKIINVLPLFALLVGCADSNTRSAASLAMTKDERYQMKNQDTLFGGPIFSTNDTKKADSDNTLPVNVYLWRASVDTVSFMPIKTVEPLGGVIATDWYMPAKSPNERIKVNIVISGNKLRADALNLTLFHEVNDPQKGWIPVSVSAKMREELEDTILTRARQLRIESKATQQKRS